MSVGLKDAHAWPELYFEGVGWTRFEPTPSRGTAPDYTLPRGPVGRPEQPGAPEAVHLDRAAAAPSALGQLPAAAAQARRVRLRPRRRPTAARRTAGPGGHRPAGWALAVLLGAGLPLLPMLWRLRVTRAPADRLRRDAHRRTPPAGRWRPGAS